MSNVSVHTNIRMVTHLNRLGVSLQRSIQCIILAIILSIIGCPQSGADTSAGSIYTAADDFFSQGKYEASLREYQKLIDKKPGIADRLLFEMAIIYAHPSNGRKNYSKAMECYQSIITNYPESQYRHDSQMMVFRIQNVMIKDGLIAEQKSRINTYYQQILAQKNEITAQQKKIESLEQTVVELWTEPVDKILIEKKKRRLILFSKGQAIKSYKIALGGNPVGPKERQGDNKTPEGNYTIESINRHSEYHLSLRISYPNARDRKNAKELGVSPGGDIMIHGIKDDLSWVGENHAKVDWTEGCIAVTNAEIEEIARLVPNGTPIKIRP